MKSLKVSISIDGIDIRDVTMESLRKQIGVVQQDVFLFERTIVTMSYMESWMQPMKK